MFTRSVLDTKRTDERSGNVLELVERRLHRDVQLRRRLRPLKRDNADVRARLFRCRGGIVEQRPTNVRSCDVHDAKQRIDEWQCPNDDEYEQARLRCDVHVQQRLLPLVVEPSHVRADGYNSFWRMGRLGANVRCGEVQLDSSADKRYRFVRQGRSLLRGVECGRSNALMQERL